MQRRASTTMNHWPQAFLANLHEDHHHRPAPDNLVNASTAEELDENPNPHDVLEPRDRRTRSSVSFEVEAGSHIVHVPPANSTSPPVLYSTFSIHVVAFLMSSSVFGTLARLGIHALSTYEGQGIFALAWDQAIGCALMGVALALREPITNLYGPLYPAITTGFCGSLTTFSAWQLDVFLAWANAPGYRRLWIYDIMDGLTRTLFTLAVSLASLALGFQLGTQITPHIPMLKPAGPFARWTITVVSAALYILTIPLFIRLNPAWRPLATAALVFSFPGTLTRYVLSAQLNSRVKSLPVGTLIANEVATALLVAFHIIQRVPSLPAPLSCSILQGLIDGYCGCLGTVSTFAAEVRTLSARRAWVYVIASFGLGQVIILVMLGSAWWTGRIEENGVCSFG